MARVTAREAFDTGEALARNAAFIGSRGHLDDANVHAFCRWRIAKVTDNPLNYNFSCDTHARVR